MQTVTIEIFKFNELSAEAQEVAVNNYRDINVDYQWWESIYEDAANIGLKITSFDLDRHRHAIGIFIDSSYDCANKIIDEHGEDCETYKTAQNFLKAYAELLEKFEVTEDNGYLTFRNDATEYDFDNELAELNDQFLKDIVEDYSIMLQDECDYLQSEEAVKEAIIANEYDFTIDGKRY